MKKLPKQKSRNQLIKDLDKVFSVFIRMRNAKDGIVKCFTCSTIKEWKNLQCGHYISRRHLATRFDEKNCQVQCAGCNIFNQGNAPVFAQNLLKLYGSDILNLLEIKKNNVSKLGTFELSCLIGEYKVKVAGLEFKSIPKSKEEIKSEVF